MKKLICIAAFLLSTQYRAFANEVVPAAPPQPQLSFAEYPKLRVGDIAPHFSLLDVNQKLINSRDFIGQSAQMWAINNRQTQPVFTFYSVFAPNLAAKRAADELRSKLANSRFPYSHGLTYAYSEVKFPEAGARLVVRELNTPVDKTNVMLIDRAGFIRFIDTVTSPDSGEFPVFDLTPELEVGKVAPDFSMVDMNGIVRRLSDLRGQKNLLLTFFPKCFTGGCTNHLTSIQKEHLSYLASETETWAVSVDPAEGEKGQLAFAARWGFQFPLIPDMGRNLSILYGAAENSQQLASRMSVLIDKDGLVRLIDKNVDIHTHGSDIILQMRRLGMIPTAAADK